MDITTKKYIKEESKQESKQTLLEKALAVPVHQRVIAKINPEEIELALAWLEGKITVTQIARAINKPNGSVQSKLSKLLRDAYEMGKLKVNR